VGCAMFEFDFDEIPWTADDKSNDNTSTLVPSVSNARCCSFQAVKRGPLIKMDVWEKQVDVEIMTLGSGVVAKLHVPLNITAIALKQKIEGLLNMPAVDQQLVIGTEQLHGTQHLWEAVSPSTLSNVQITVVRVPGAKRIAISGGRDGTIRLWDLDRNRTTRHYAGHLSCITCLSADWASKRLLTGGEGGCLHLWELESWTLVRELQGTSSSVKCLAVDWLAQQAVSGSSDGKLHVWDVDDGILSDQLLGHTTAVHCVAINAKKGWAVSGGGDCLLRVWDLESGAKLMEFVGFQPVTSVCVNFDAEPLPFAVAGSNALLRFRTLNTYSYHWDMSVHTSVVTCLAIHWKTLYVVSGSADGTLQAGCMNLNNNRIEKPKTLRGHTASVTCVSVEWSKNTAASGSEDHTIRIWDLTRGVKLQVLHGHTHDVLCVALNMEDSRDHHAEQPHISDNMGYLAQETPLSRARQDAGIAEHPSCSHDLALNQPVEASSCESPAHAAINAVDGNPETRWSSEYSDSQWLSVDLGSVRRLSHVEIRWETAYASSYSLHISEDGIAWTTAASELGQPGWVVTLLSSLCARWVRMCGNKRATAFGFSIWEFRVIGEAP